MSIKSSIPTRAFGVDGGYAPYRLRQARYHALAEDVAGYVERHYAETGRPADVLDVGVCDGVSRRYIEVHPADKHIRYHGADIFPHGRQHVYKHRRWTLYDCDLEDGLVGLPSDRFDIVVCEQVLEHLNRTDLALADLVRVLKPGGLLVLGVPIFPHGVHWIRRHVIPIMDRLFRIKKVRSHIQAFSKRSFLQLLNAAGDVSISQSRGFRIVSGGVLRPLEYHRWWWRLNRTIGALVPSLCVEIQVLATKPGEASLAEREPIRKSAA